jgi:hypothetical protein
MHDYLRKKKGISSFRSLVLLLGLLCILMVMFPGILAQEDGEGGDDFNEMHCTVGLIGVALVVVVLVFGFIVSGRFTHKKYPKLKLVHKYLTLLMTIFFTGQSLWGVLLLQWLFIANLHGYLGIAIPFVAWVNIGISPCVAKRFIPWKYASLVHTLLAFVLLALVILQVAYGYVFLE